MNPIERALGILLLLSSGKLVSATTLAERFDVSLRTVYRDIDRLIAAPLETYRGLYRKLGLAWSDEIEAKINEGYSSSGGSSSVPKAGRAHDASRNVSEVNSYWTKVMSPEEIDTVEQIVHKRWDAIRALPTVSREPEAS